MAFLHRFRDCLKEIRKWDATYKDNREVRSSRELPMMSRNIRIWQDKSRQKTSFCFHAGKEWCCNSNMILFRTPLSYNWANRGTPSMVVAFQTEAPRRGARAVICIRCVTPSSFWKRINGLGKFPAQLPFLLVFLSIPKSPCLFTARFLAMVFEK